MTTQNTCKKHCRTKRPDEKRAFANKAHRISKHLARVGNTDHKARSALEAIPAIYRKGFPVPAQVHRDSLAPTLTAARKSGRPGWAERKAARTRIRYIVYGQQSNKSADLTFNPAPDPFPDAPTIIKLKREVKDLYPLTGWGWNEAFEDEGKAAFRGFSLSHLLADFDRRYSKKEAA